MPKYVQAAQSKWREVTELNPDLFFLYTVYDDLFVARSAVAKYVNADPEDVVFVENASEGPEPEASPPQAFPPQALQPKVLT